PRAGQAAERSDRGGAVQGDVRGANVSASQMPAARLVSSDEDRRDVLGLIDQSLRTGSLTLGPHTAAFEDAFRARHDVPFAVAVSSGPSALEIILRTVGVEGRDVVVPTNTFFATAGPAPHARGGPPFGDVAPGPPAFRV